MPSLTPKQHRTMEMAEHDPARAARYGIHIPKRVAHEFNQADIGRYRRGGVVELPQIRPAFMRTTAHLLKSRHHR